MVLSRVEITKICSSCSEILPLSSFNKKAAGQYGVRPECRGCQKKSTARYIEKIGRDTFNENARKNHLSRKFDLTFEQFAEKVAAQDGKCPICGNELVLERSHYGIDHVHTDADGKYHQRIKGPLRDILCQGCNCGLGNFEDDPERLRNAADYIEEHRRRVRG